MTETNLLLAFIATGIFILVFLAILGLCLKLYTEYFKDISKSNKGTK